MVVVRTEIGVGRALGYRPTISQCLPGPLIVCIGSLPYISALCQCLRKHIILKKQRYNYLNIRTYLCMTIFFACYNFLIGSSKPTTFIRDSGKFSVKYLRVGIFVLIVDLLARFNISFSFIGQCFSFVYVQI